MSGELMHEETGEVLSKEEGQDRIRRTIERTGRLVLESIFDDAIGTVCFFAGLPFRLVRKITYEDAQVDYAKVRDIWGEITVPDPNNFFFEVEVAD